MKTNQKDTIVIYRNNNEVVALNQKSKKKGIAKCHPYDEFDFNVGAKLAFDRLMSMPTEEEPKFQVGDHVRIVNTGAMFTTYVDWVIKHVADPRCVAKYAYNDSTYNRGIKELDGDFVVRAVGIDKAFVEDEAGDGKCYLVGFRGLERYK